MNVLFLVPRTDKASTRYRVLHYLPFLEKAGMACEVCAISGRVVPRLGLPARIARADVVFVQKKLLTGILGALVRRMAKRLVFDFDDAIMYKEAETKEASRHRQFRRFVTTVRRADLVICGNRYLAGQTGNLCKNLRILPTVVDEHLYVPRPAPDVAPVKEGPVIGWIGSRHTLPYLKAIAPVLQQVCGAVPGARLKIVADDFFDLEGVEVLKKEWRSGEEVADLQSMDIGVMPLPDTPWCRGKCGFKLIQYMAVGLPVVCSPVGANADIVTDGREGFYARTPEEWGERLLRLLKDAALRQAMGARGRETILARYSLPSHAAELIRLLDGFSEGARKDAGR